MIKKNFKKRIYTSFILLLLIFLIFIYNPVLVFTLIVLGVLSIIEFFNLIKKIPINKFYLFITNFLFVTYISIFCY